MAHQIQDMHGRAMMAFTGETPWHGLGQRVTIGASVDEWRVQAGLDYDVLSAPVQFTGPDGVVSEMPSRRVFYRSNDGHPLAVNSDGYKVHQNREILEMFREICGDAGAQIHTAGAIDGGRIVWVMAKLPTLTGTAAPADQVRGNLVVSTSVDGSMKTEAFLCAVRVVCANTHRIARLEAGTNKITQSHRSTFDGARLTADLAGLSDQFGAYLEHARKLSQVHIGGSEALDVVRTILAGKRWLEFKKANAEAPQVAPVAVDADPFGSLLDRPARLMDVEADADAAAAMREVGLPTFRAARGEARVLELFEGKARGADSEGAQGTAWGLYNAMSEYVDHERGTGASSRLTSAWYGEGDALKRSTFDLLLSMA